MGFFFFFGGGRVILLTKTRIRFEKLRKFCRVSYSRSEFRILLFRFTRERMTIFRCEMNNQRRTIFSCAQNSVAGINLANEKSCINHKCLYNKLDCFMRGTLPKLYGNCVFLRNDTTGYTRVRKRQLRRNYIVLTVVK